MGTETAILKGKIKEFVCDGTYAVVETNLGNAFLDIDDALDFRLQAGDEIEVEDAGWYAKDGRIVTILGYKYTLNRLIHTVSDNT